MTTYKYLPPERIRVLSDGLIRFIPPSDLNDPFECVPIISLEETRRVLDAYIEETEAGILDDIINEGLPRKADWEAFQQRKKELLAKLEENPSEIRDHFFQEAERRINTTIGILSLSKRWDSSLMWAHYCASHTGFCVGSIGHIPSSEEMTLRRPFEMSYMQRIASRYHSNKEFQSTST